MAGDMSQLLATKLGQAVQSNHVEELKQLLADGEDPLFKDKAGNTPLHMSALSNECAHVSDLMTAGIDPFAKNREGKTAMEIETQNKWWLRSYKVYEPGVFACVDAHDIPKFEELISKWCRLDAVHKSGRTLRQYAAKKSYHDMVAIIDRNSHTLDCIYGVKEEKSEKVFKALKKSICRVNFLNMGVGPEHVLQCAIDSNRLDYVTALCEAGADVNLWVRIKKYFKGPMYFEVIRKRPGLKTKIMEKVLDSSIDVTAKDERGRTPLIYAVDKASDEMLPYIVDFLIEHGVNIAERDHTGASARDVAKLAGRKYAVEAIDRLIIKLIRKTDLDALWELAVSHYDDFNFEYRYKDTLIYAAGNEDDTATKWLEGLSKFLDDVKQFHHYIWTNNVGMSRFLLKENPHRDKLLRAKDRGGRTPLILAVMSGSKKYTMFLLEEEPGLINMGRDNLYRTALHYGYGLGQSGLEILELLKNNGADETAEDVFQKKPRDYAPTATDDDPALFIKEEREKEYGLKMEMYCLKKYEALRRIIRSKDETSQKYKEFLKSVRGVWYPMSVIPAKLNPGGVPLMKGFKDLIFYAIEKKDEDITKKLLFLGADTERKEMIRVKTTDENGDTHRTYRQMNAAEYCEHLGWLRMSEYLRTHQFSGKEKLQMFSTVYWVGIPKEASSQTM
ncbi:uncharacterized protein LOC135499780 isoform X2 [Lineus longissimus]|uniref:uncharacterized protein LOC135499780 isoform X2 n=1 Tax=Lineus longissimus TaxID=88925 RepID=UPI00315CD911